MAIIKQKDYNNHLIEKNIDINIIDYVKEINKLVYNIDISFIDDFLNLVEKDEICIPHRFLIDYGVITVNKGTTDITRMLNQFEPIEGEDYNLRNVAVVRTNRGNVIKKEYTLHPRLFKLCLMRSKNNQFLNQPIAL